MKTNLQRIIGFFLLPVIWYLAADVFAIANPGILPKLSAILQRFSVLLSNGSLVSDLTFTIYRWLIGFSLGVVAGVLAGLLIGVSKSLRSLLEFPIEFLRSMPVTAIFPLFLIFFGIGDESKIAMAFTPTFLLMLVNTSYGVTLADPIRRRMAAVFGASKFQTFRYIVSMDALPQIFIGLRLSLSMSLVVTVVSEMFIGTEFGLGQKVYDSYLTNSLTTLYSLLIVLGLLGYCATRLLMFLEARLLFWTGK